MKTRNTWAAIALITSMLALAACDPQAEREEQGYEGGEQESGGTQQGGGGATGGGGGGGQSSGGGGY